MAITHRAVYAILVMLMAFGDCAFAAPTTVTISSDSNIIVTTKLHRKNPVACIPRKNGGYRVGYLAVKLFKGADQLVWQKLTASRSTKKLRAFCSVGTPLNQNSADGETDLCKYADLSGNGVIDFADTAKFLAVWKTKGTAHDLNADGIVDTADLSLLLSCIGTPIDPKFPVNPDNQIPVANALNISIMRNVATPITLTGSDAEGAELSFSIFTSPSHGSLTGTGAALIYTPDSDYIGADTFSFRTFDGALYSAAAVVTFDVKNPETKEVGWTDRGFDLTLTNAVSSSQWDAYSSARYIIVPNGGDTKLSIVRNSAMRNANGDLSQAGTTRVRIGALSIARANQVWTPEWDHYNSAASIEYGAPIEITHVTEPVPVIIWNQHPGIRFDTSSWLGYGSNALILWLLPQGSVPGDVPPVYFSNGRIPSGLLQSAPPGKWPALYTSTQDEARLRNAITKIKQNIRGDSGPYDQSLGKGGNFWNRVAGDAAINALIGWNSASQAHLDRAKAQLLAIHANELFGHEVGGWFRARVTPNAQLSTTYGRELQASFFNAMVATSVLGPNMANVLTPQELAAINAHLYRFAINDVYASVTTDQYYTADGGINLYQLPISVVAGWNWNISDAANLASGNTLPELTHMECVWYFNIATGTADYGTRACQNYFDPGYLTVGNLEAATFFVRFAEYFGKDVLQFGRDKTISGTQFGITQLKAFVTNTYAGVPIDSVSNPRQALMDSWQPVTP